MQLETFWEKTVVNLLQLWGETEEHRGRLALTVALSEFRWCGSGRKRAMEAPWACLCVPERS